VAVEQNRARTGERFAVVMAGRQVRQQPIQMTELATIPAEYDPLAAPRAQSDHSAAAALIRIQIDR
jgi:hypothetical protein